jgi:glycosyltransferase involved in cell wall biosynthesis
MPSVVVLLCTLNGARFLPAQLLSLADQTLANWRLFVSDDGSTDETLAILSRCADKLGSAPIVIRNGPRQGFVNNFLGLVCDPAISADYYAYSDQDDIWESDKLSRAVEWLETRRPTNVPALYCSRTRLIDERGRECGLSPLFRRKPDFRNALVQSIAGGNTMVFNETARQLLIACGSSVPVPTHDWWTYLLTTAAGGEINYDPIPSVRYRIHPENVIGSNAGWFSRARRLQKFAAGRFAYWTNLNIAALAPFRPRMTQENRDLFDLLCASRKRDVIGRLIGFRNASVYRQTFLDNLGLLLAVWTQKI